ncbi:hypothetical protein [Bosea sp. BIWAKO-01]|uniref:hypothetical protein n=1 Tax=Bosea sp. BIWAKO-01 TaxID=506668 RepID=UPI00114CE7B0|nr:hypothetical protein [Bosea sp. BIWAKO-01]
MAFRAAFAGVTLVLAHGASVASQEEPISRPVFAVLLSPLVKQQGVSLSSQTDCDHPAVNCKVLEPSQNVEIWLRPDERGNLASVQINFDAINGRPEPIFVLARKICSAAIGVLAIRPLDARVLEPSFSQARITGHWEGFIAGQKISVRLYPTYSFGACEVTASRK